MIAEGRVAMPGDSRPEAASRLAVASLDGLLGARR
jgi:hypothetical protein